ncbi:MAG: glycosyltransferase family 4 protein [Burkholderiales bacterium]|nr:glycosyltransferase family 4 protein [Burkholderiales bacterium]
MKLAIVRQAWNPHGGAERFIDSALAALAAEDDLELTVIARTWQPRAGVRFIACNPPYRTSWGRDRGFARAVAEVLGRPGVHFDIVQSHERIPGMMLFRAGDGVHATWLEQRARTLPAWRRASIALNPHHRRLLEVERRMFTHPALRMVICNSAMVRDDIAARFGTPAARLTVIHNGVDLERFHPRLREGRAAVRAALDTPGDAPVFLYVGSGFERKGVARLLQALAAAPPGCHAWIAGRDKRAARYQELAQRLGLAARVRFLGGRDDLPQLYGAADAFVLPTLYDPMPNAALEALAAGLPVVTTQQSGARELVRDGGNGFVLDVLDQPGLARALALLAAPGRAAAMGDAARGAVTHLHPAAMAARLTALYRQLRPAPAAATA